MAPDARARLRLTREDCAQTGAQLSRWYFGAGGLLMSEEARASYFALMEGLRLAATADQELVAATSEEHLREMSAGRVKKYRDDLGNLKGVHTVFAKLAKGPIRDGDLADYRFGEPADGASGAKRFKDFVLIQQLASRFRTALTDDIRSRKAPGAWAEDTAASPEPVASSSPGLGISSRRRR